MIKEAYIKDKVIKFSSIFRKRHKRLDDVTLQRIISRIDSKVRTEMGVRFGELEDYLSHYIHQVIKDEVKNLEQV